LEDADQHRVVLALRLLDEVRRTIRSLRVKGVRGAVRVFAFEVTPEQSTPGLREAIDPVCGMKVAPTSNHEYRHRERVYRFCSAGCRARFVRGPARFVRVARRR
jgi:YHS domain-containing protein